MNPKKIRTRSVLDKGAHRGSQAKGGRGVGIRTAGLDSIRRHLRSGVGTGALAAAGLLTLAGPALGQTTAAAAASAANAGGQLQEVVVTAEFRRQNLQSTPLAITAMTGQMLEARNSSNIVDISNAAPNVTIRMAP